MFGSEWREFPSAPCLAGKIKLMTARVSMLLKSRARPLHASKLVSFLVGLRTYQHPGINLTSYVNVFHTVSSLSRYHKSHVREFLNIF